MNIKKILRYLAIFVILGLVAVGVVLTLSKKKVSETSSGRENVTEEQGNGGIGEKNIVSSQDKENYYTSTSADFPTYSFICPDGWSLFEEEGGRRVTIKNFQDEENISFPVEAILIMVEPFSKFKEEFKEEKDVSEIDTIINNSYLEVTENLDGVSLIEDTIFIDGVEAKLLGYTYDSHLNGSAGNEDVDILSYVEKNGYVYVLKYMGSNVDKEKSKNTFKSFISTLSFKREGESVRKDDKSPSMNILILGDDSSYDRPGGRVSGRTDIMILFHINLETYQATIVTIPRDTWVEIPGHSEGKINGAHAIGGVDLTIKTVEKLSGLDIDNYIITDFDGFIPLIDFLGGVTIEVEEDLADGFSGCYLNKGVHHLSGEEALALCRNRHRPGGAYARERESARVILALYEQNSSLRNILKFPAFINYLLKYTWTDFDFIDFLKLIPVLGKLDSQNIEITTIPSWPQMVGDASAVVYDEEETRELFEKIKNQ